MPAPWTPHARRRGATVSRVAEPGTVGPGRAARRIGAALAGPSLIAGAVLVVLHRFAFAGLVTLGHVDIAGYWMPTYCLLGRSLAAGHLPAWNPYPMGGLPFAADPQSGWMSLPVMALFAALPCDAAMRAYIVLLPVVAGVGMHLFLRAERLPRAAAAIGGLALAMTVAGSRLAITIPFSSSLAWTAVVLAGTARYLHATRWSNRLLWALVTALAWGQLAASHLSHGLALGTAAAAAYFVARASLNARDSRLRGSEALGLAALLLASFLLVNVAYLLPRLAYLPRTTLGLGYAGLQALGDRLAGREPRMVGVAPGATWQWPLVLSLPPGPYLGSIPLLLSFAAWWNRRRRPLVIALAALGVACYLLSIRDVAVALAALARALPYGDFYLHSPLRFRYPLLVLVAVLAAVGAEAWTAPSSARRRAAMLAPGILVWFAVPPLAGVRSPRLAAAAAAAVAGLALLTLVARRPRAVALLPVALAVELAASGLAGQAIGPGHAEGGLDHRQLMAFPVPDVRADAYTRPDRLARFLLGQPGTGRYLSLNPERGYLSYQRPDDWPFLTSQRSMLFELEEAQGYNPVQPVRTWSFVRGANAQPVPYHSSILMDPPAVALDLFDVEWIVAATEAEGEPGARPVLRDGAWTLYRRADAPGRASVVTRSTVARDGDEALRRILAPGFDPRREVVLEAGPGPGAVHGRQARPAAGGAPSRPAASARAAREPGAGGTGRASYRWRGPQEAVIDVSAPRSGFVLVRNTYDPNWRATVDGRPAPVLRANHFLMAVPVAEGRHRVTIAYDDPWVAYGLLGSGLAVSSLLAAAWALRRRERSTGSRGRRQATPAAGGPGGGGKVESVRWSPLRVPLRTAPADPRDRRR